MASSSNRSPRVVTDSIHGDIELTDSEWRVVNTATFQRLRSLKQLGMGHLVYPNATHTRFAHSLGVFRIMCRVLERLDHAELREQKDDLRLAALLHDIGHYPYSHLMERVDWVKLTEEEIEQTTPKVISGAKGIYPDHEELGRHILLSQKDICEAVGGKARAKRIGVMFSRLKGVDPQFSKLIHSSLDMDRLDYLVRDARAAGVPYGEIDLNYLLNNIRISPKGMLGVDQKALAAAEHFLMARMFMHRVVYYHKTTYGFEEACRQLLRRVRDSGRFHDVLPADGNAILDICSGRGIRDFTDNYVDRIVLKAVEDENPTIKMLAKTIVERRPLRLIAEVAGVIDKTDRHPASGVFRQQCRDKLAGLARKHKLKVEQFLLCGPKPIKFEQRGSLLTPSEHDQLEPEEWVELIMIFRRGQDEPQSIVDIDGSIIKGLSNHLFSIQRLYLVDDGSLPKAREQAIQAEVRKWTSPTT